VYEDRSGPAIVRVIKESFPDAEISLEVVADGEPSVAKALTRHLHEDWIFTTGGTGASIRDKTPEATEKYCDRFMPGIEEYLRAKSIEQTPFAVFSRGVAGMRENQYIVNFPGSESAAEYCANLMVPLLTHGIDMAHGKGH
jgi:molybdopterin adenylyltransferase